MAYEAYPRDSRQAYEDPGLYYVNEKGKLRSPPGAGRACNSSTAYASLGQSPPGINGIFQDKRHQSVTKETCHDGSTRNVYHPKKLFDVSMMFVADNIRLVESLAGFPEIVGEQLFNTAMELGKFGDEETAVVALQLFYDAYGDAVLGSLSLRDEHTVLSQHLDCILLLTGLRARDLGGCGLGNDVDHDILAVVSNMYSLQELCLCDNGLNDDSIQKMTTPLRMLGRGPKGLQVLDLSGNGLLTNRGVKYLCAFTSLRVVDLSGTNVTAGGITRIQSKIPSLRAADTVYKTSQFPIKIHSRGWAVPLVHSWLCAPKAAKTQGTRSSAASAFYGKLSVIPPPTLEDPVNSKKRHPIIQLVADDHAVLTHDPTVSTSDLTGLTYDGLPPPPKRLKKSMRNEPIATNSVTMENTLLKSKQTHGRDPLTEKSLLRNNKFSKMRLKNRKYYSVKPEEKMGVKLKSNSSLSSVSGVKNNEEDDDLMLSYLQARSKDYGCSTKGP